MTTNCQPIFLVGSQRSGTTLLRLMLRHHPQISWCNPFKYAVDQVSENGDFPTLKDYYRRLEIDPKFIARGLTLDRNLNYPELVNSFLVQQRERDGKPLVGATVHHYMDRAFKIWPNARFIHIVRDGRDVARSGIPLGWAGNLWTAVEPWMYAERLWETLRQQIPADQQFELSYEELVLQPQEVLTGVCRFIGVPYDSAMLSYSNTSSYDQPDPKLLGQWRSRLCDRDIQLVESRIADLLVERGYELSGLPILSISPVQKLALKVQDQWYRQTFLLRRYGMALTVSDYLSKWLKITPWQKSVQSKMRTIQQSYIR